MDKKKVIISVILAIIVIASLGVIIFTDGESNEEQKKPSGGSSFVDNGGKAPSKIETSEKDVTEAIANELEIKEVYYEKNPIDKKELIKEAKLIKNEETNTYELGLWVKDSSGCRIYIQYQERGLCGGVCSVFRYAHSSGGHIAEGRGIGCAAVGQQCGEQGQGVGAIDESL